MDREDNSAPLCAHCHSFCSLRWWQLLFWALSPRCHECKAKIEVKLPLIWRVVLVLPAIAYPICLALYIQFMVDLGDALSCFHGIGLLTLVLAGAMLVLLISGLITYLKGVPSPLGVNNEIPEKTSDGVGVHRK